MHRSSTIDSAEALVKGFANSIRNGEYAIGDVQALIMDCTEGDEELTRLVLEKTKVRLECLFHMAVVS